MIFIHNPSVLFHCYRHLQWTDLQM
uniref:Uncharacterized protein n=1 Tax=Anguilla anguilla TaxID=7936 RepID=A0A0E9XZ39_ANGAN